MRRVKRTLPVLAALAYVFAGAEAGAAARNTAGVFDYYALVLSWVPSYCQSEGTARNDAQCEAPQRPAFRLHGLWPQYEEGWPEDCPIGKRPWVPDRVIREMRDIMPSKSLIIHEYRVHGTCSGFDPWQYFGVTRELYERVSVPERFRAPEADRVLSPEAIESEFLAANPWLKPEMIAVSCRRQNLVDIRVCFGRDLFPRACGANEDQKRLCPATKIEVPPVKP
jgi:ribonuclease T2